MNSVAIVTGITIFVTVILVMGGPELLRWLAGRNRDRYQLLQPAQTALAEQLRRTAADLREFRPLQAPVYQETYERTRVQMEEAVGAFRTAQQQQQVLRLPVVSEEGLAIRQILQQPQYLAVIPRDAARLGRLERLLTRARRALGEVRAGLDTLARVPVDLQTRARAVSSGPLQELATALAAEAEAGVTGLSELETRQEALAEEAQALAQLLRREPDQPLAQLDALAQALAQVERATAELAAELEERVGARRVLDEQVARTQATQVRLVQAEAPVLAPLLARSNRLLAAAGDARREANFTRAGEAAAQAQALLSLADELAEVAKKVTALEAIANVSLEASQIAELAQAQQRAHNMVKERLSMAGAGAAQEETLAGGALQVLDRLQRQTRELDARAERLLAQHQSHVQELEEEAAQEEQALAQVWQRLLQLMPPAAGDPLANRYQLLAQQRQEAKGKPALLRAYVGAARGLATRVADTAGYLDENLRWAAGLREEISELLARAEQEAGEWHALRPLVMEIRESAAAIWQVDPVDAGTLADAYEALDELQGRQEQALDAWEALQAGRQRLAAVEQRIERTEAALADAAVGPEEWQRVEQLAQGFFTDAQQATTVDGAVLALQEVERVLRNVVMGE